MKGYKYIALILALVLILAGCSGKTKPTGRPEDSGQSSAQSSGQNSSGQVLSGQDSETVTRISGETSVDELLASMTLEEKVGQIGRAHV